MNQTRDSKIGSRQFKSLFALFILLLVNFVSYFHFIFFRPETPDQLLSVRPFVMTYTIYLSTEGVLAPMLTIMLVKNIQNYAKVQLNRLIGSLKTLCSRKGNTVSPQPIL